jgi:hypothetical protein
MNACIAANVIELPPGLLELLFLAIIGIQLLAEDSAKLKVGVLPSALPAMRGGKGLGGSRKPGFVARLILLATHVFSSTSLALMLSPGLGIIPSPRIHFFIVTDGSVLFA